VKLGALIVLDLTGAGEWCTKKAPARPKRHGAAHALGPSFLTRCAAEIYQNDFVLEAKKLMWVYAYMQIASLFAQPRPVP